MQKHNISTDYRSFEVHARKEYEQEVRQIKELQDAIYPSMASYFSRLSVE